MLLDHYFYYTTNTRTTSSVITVGINYYTIMFIRVIFDELKESVFLVITCDKYQDIAIENKLKGLLWLSTVTADRGFGPFQPDVSWRGITWCGKMDLRHATSHQASHCWICIPRWVLLSAEISSIVSWGKGFFLDTTTLLRYMGTWERYIFFFLF